jgi:thiol-disulfide isomerase/thioredoxin
VPAANAASPPLARELKPYAGNPEAAALALPRLGGGRIDLAGLRGQAVLVNFWASWCPPCVREMPSMQRLQEKLAGRPFRVLAVNMGETEAEIAAFLRRMKVDFPVLLDRSGEALKRWKVFVFPTSFVLDPAGQIRYGVFGEIEWDSAEVVRLIEELMPRASAAYPES